MNADTQQWLLWNTNPDVLSLMPPTIMATLNLRLVFSGLLAQSLHGTAVVAGNILLDLVKHYLLLFQLPTPFQLHAYLLLSPLLYIITFHAKHSICSFHHTVWFSHFRLLYSEKYLIGLKDLYCYITGNPTETFLSYLLCYWFTSNYPVLPNKENYFTKLMNLIIRPTYGSSSSWG